MLLIDYLLKKFWLKDCSNLNSLKTKKACRTKAQCILIFKNLKLQHPKGITLFNPFKALIFSKNHSFPFVVKPNRGGFSRGAYFPIYNNKSLIKACFLSKIYFPFTRVERYFFGKNYRVLVGKEGVFSIIQRHPSCLIGDGKRTIFQLINLENKHRIDQNLLPIHSLISHAKSKKFLKKINSLYTINSVPKMNEYVALGNKITLNSGGSIESFDHTQLSASNVKKFLGIARYLDADLLGIDIITARNITDNLDEQAHVFLEINSRPYIKMHDSIRYGIKNIKLPEHFYYEQ